MRRRWLSAVLLTGFVALAATPADALTVTTLDYPGVTFSENIGINHLGQIVGIIDGSDVGQGRGFLYSGGIFSIIDVPGSTFVHAGGINDLGVIVGTYGTSDGGVHGYRLTGTTVEQLDVPGATRTFGRGINSHGEVVGEAIIGGESEAFLFSGGVFTILDVPGSNSNAAYGINDDGVIVGTAVSGTTFTYQAGVFGVLTPSLGFAINNHGDVAGGGGTAYIRTADGAVTELDGMFAAHGLNDSRTAVGYYFDGGRRHGFVAALDNAAPVSEPSTLLLLAAGSLAAVFVHLRRAARS